MSNTNNKPIEADDYTAVVKKKLEEKIIRFTEGNNKLETKIPGLDLHRWDQPTRPISYMMAPSICLVIQGEKHVLLGENSYVIDENHFLVTSLDLPVIASITKASEDEPYLGITYVLDHRVITNLMVESRLALENSKKESTSIAVSRIQPSLLDLFLRLLNLIDEPEHISVIAPLIQKEIIFRLLISEQGPRLREIGLSTSHEYQIARAIDWMKQNYASRMSIEKLASRVKMSTSALHFHFRQMTNMSPLQYQKWLRLHEARRLMFTEKVDASNAAFEVGYESPSQFSREYKRMFGNPPLKDIKQLNDDIAVSQ